MTISSPAFANKGIIPPPFTCEGDNSNPPLEIAGVPPEAITLAITVEDPDSPNGTWQHWLIWNLSPLTKQLAPTELPKGASQGINDFGRVGYGGPCPAQGVHHYVFSLYALDTKLMLAAGANRASFNQAIRNNVLAEAEFVGRFGHSPK